MSTNTLSDKDILFITYFMLSANYYADEHNWNLVGKYEDKIRFRLGIQTTSYFAPF